MFVRTVLGDVAPTDLGQVLIHEHLVVDVRQRHAGYADDAETIAAGMLDHLSDVRDLGVRTIVDCTPTHLGRHEAAYRLAAMRLGIHVVMACGTYREAWLTEEIVGLDESALADWYRRGLDAAGFVKLGCDPEGPGAGELRCARAAGRASRATGALVACHVGLGGPAWRTVDAFEAGGGDPERFVVVHLQNEADFRAHLALARRGVWLEYDAIGAAPPDEVYGAILLRLRDAGLLSQVLISQDACAYIVGNDGTAQRQHRFDHLHRAFLPHLRSIGFSESDIRTLLIDNPARALARPGTMGR